MVKYIHSTLNMALSFETTCHLLMGVDVGGVITYELLCRGERGVKGVFSVIGKP